MGETKVKDLPAHKRPRERLFSDGPQHLSEVQLLAILLGSGRPGLNALSLARKILTSFSLKRLTEVKLENLVAIGGVGRAGAARIVAALELGGRASRQNSSLPTVTTPQDVLLLLNKLSRFQQEHLIGLYLNSRYRLLRETTIAIGSINLTLIQPRDVFAPALSIPATALVLAHNHPSGEVQPSQDDLDLTERIAQAGNLFGIQLLDHLIMAGKNYFSFREANLLKPLDK